MTRRPSGLTSSPVRAVPARVGSWARLAALRAPGRWLRAVGQALAARGDLYAEWPSVRPLDPSGPLFATAQLVTA
jgi:hypothetical protein